MILIRTEAASPGEESSHIEMTKDEAIALELIRSMARERDIASQKKQDAEILLSKSDITICRCLEIGISIPAEWVTYRASLRPIAKTGIGNIPEQPAYPEGT